MGAWDEGRGEGGWGAWMRDGAKEGGGMDEGRGEGGWGHG